MRFLVALEDEYRAYREVLAASVKGLRPGFLVSTTVPSCMDDELKRFDPQAIISSEPGAAGPDAAGPGDGITWFELPTDSSRPTIVSFGGHGLKRINPTLDVLLEIVGETERVQERDTG